jgi:hypothetical protein
LEFFLRIQEKRGGETETVKETKKERPCQADISVKRFFIKLILIFGEINLIMRSGKLS